jgi:hypothetical protein
MPPRNMVPKQIRTPAEVPFIVTIGVSQDHYLGDCSRALALLKRYGFEAAATKHDTFDLIAEDHDQLPQLREIHDSGER